MGDAAMRFVGWAETFDLTVEGANHYITETGLVQAQTHIAFDELVQFNEEQYDQIVTRLRSSDPVLATMMKVRSMSNPMMDTHGMDGVSVRNPHWVRDRFVKPHIEGGKTLVRRLTMLDGTKRKYTYIYLRATLADNPDPAFRAQYEFQLQSAKPHIRQALLYGNWFITAGSFYGDVWNENMHTCDTFKIPDDWPVMRSMDWGFKAPGCIHWGALDPDGTLWIFREYTFKQKTAREVAERVRDMEEDMGLWGDKRSLITGPADTQLWEKRGDVGLSKAEEFAALGIGWVPADKRSRERNAERIYERLGDHGNNTEPPGLIFFRARCPKLIETLPAIQTDPDNVNCPQDGGDDHWHDCVHGDSLVETPDGSVKIRELKPGALVLSTDGAYWPCTGGRMVSPRDQMLRVRFDGGELIATGNHLVLCANGHWKRVDQLDSGCYIYRPWTQSSSPRPARSSLDADSIDVGDIFAVRSAEAANYFTGWSLPRAPRSPTPMTSTTWIMTPATTDWRTYELSPGESIGPLMGQKALPWREALTFGRPKRPPSYGTAVTRDALGTGSTQPNPYTEPRRSARQRAKPVAPISPIGALAAKAGGAPASARPEQGELAEETMSPGCALPVGERFWRTGMSLRDIAPGHAYRVLAVEAWGEGETWCTTVPVMGAFVANGIVVSNSLSYMCAFASRGAKGIPKKKRKDEWDDEKPEKSPRGAGFGYGF